MPSSTAKRHKNISILYWFIALCAFNVFLCILITRSKHAMNAAMYKIGSINIPVDGWSLSHFVMYAVIGFTCHTNILPFIVFGIAFEIVEEIGGIFEKKLSRGKESLDWFGRISDPFVNTMGLVAGQALGKKFNNGITSKDENRHLLESCLLTFNFSVLWYMISEVDQQLNISKSVYEGYKAGKGGLESLLDDVADSL